MIVMARERLTRRAGGKQPSCKNIKKGVGEPGLKGNKAGRQARKGEYEPGGKLPGPPWGGGASGLLY